MNQTQTVNEEKLMDLFQNVFSQISGSLGLMMAYLGDQTGLYRKIEAIGPCSVEELAKDSDMDERYLREWLSSNAAHGYVTYDAEVNKFYLTPEQAVIFCREGEPQCLQGLIQGVIGQMATQDVALDVFKTGRGRPWSEHHSCCFCGTDRFFRPAYVSHLVEEWIPSITGLEDKLKSGGKVADIGCGLGSTTILMAETYPNSHIYGYDFHVPSIEEAQERAKEKGLTNITFEVRDSKDIPDSDFDAACIFDALHDMGDPIGVAKGIKDILKDNGSFMLVEPFAEDNLKDNLTPSSAMMYGFSTLVCVPTSRSQEVALCLGAQAGPKKLTEVLNEAGFEKVRISATTTSNLVFEAMK
ncbi:MAG: class I SAM-dependent methyltransferase [Gammaproteobacteria bacterium]